MRKALALAFLATSALATGPAWAQSSDKPDTDTSHTQVAGLEKVVVTARKREEDEQAVPISITAFSQADRRAHV